MSKTAILRVTREVLADALGLPGNAKIDAVFVTSEDIASDTFSFRVRGVGEEVTHGATFKVFTIDELRHG
jgi:hypothetical protein